MKTVMLLAAVFAILLSPAAAAAQANGQARAVHATVHGLLGSQTTTLADTGTLSTAGDARAASEGAGSVPGLLSGNTLHAATVGSSDTVTSEASLGDLNLSVGGTTVGAGFVMARAIAGQDIGTAGAVNIHGLSINGLPVAITGEKNQTISIPGGQVVVNEQQQIGNKTVVNAIHVVVSGVADVVVASASAGVQ